MNSLANILKSCLIMACFINMSIADTLDIRYGAGILNHSNTVGFLSVGKQKPVYDALVSYTELGLFTDSDKGRSSSLFVSTGIGAHIRTPYLYIESIHGIGFIMKPDSQLGGNLQFFHNLSIGLVDYTNSTLGIGVEHISSAGLNYPNIGRNFVLVKVGLIL